MQNSIRSSVSDGRGVWAFTLAMALITGGCASMGFQEPVADVGWSTDYENALSPHTQLALGFMEAMEGGQAPTRDRVLLAERWELLAHGIAASAPDDQINRDRLMIEELLDPHFITEVKERRYTRWDLMRFMRASGMRVPAGGPGSINPDLIAARHTVEKLMARP
jgi:hypothetical protein